MQLGNQGWPVKTYSSPPKCRLDQWATMQRSKLSSQVSIKPVWVTLICKLHACPRLCTRFKISDVLDTLFTPLMEAPRRGKELSVRSSKLSRLGRYGRSAYQTTESITLMNWKLTSKNLKVRMGKVREVKLALGSGSCILGWQDPISCSGAKREGW